MVGAWRMMVMHARDSARARGMLTLYVFARRVVRSMPAADVPFADVATADDVPTRRRDGVRSAMAAERPAAMTTSPTSTASAMSTATASTASTAATCVATAATAGGC
jgi:hypothetical protein